MREMGYDYSYSLQANGKPRTVARSALLDAALDRRPPPSRPAARLPPAEVGQVHAPAFADESDAPASPDPNARRTRLDTRRDTGARVVVRVADRPVCGPCLNWHHHSALLLLPRRVEKPDHATLATTSQCMDHWRTSPTSTGTTSLTSTVKRKTFLATSN